MLDKISNLVLRRIGIRGNYELFKTRYFKKDFPHIFSPGEVMAIYKDVEGTGCIRISVDGDVFNYSYSILELGSSVEEITKERYYQILKTFKTNNTTI